MKNGSLPLPSGEGRGEGWALASKESVRRARTLRRQATPAESKLWYALRDCAFKGTKFRRQLPFGPYILDFAVWASRLCIEVDGDMHAQADGPARDARRDALLAREGWRVLRFTNREGLSNLPGVLLVVASALARPHPDPLPEGEGEAAASSFPGAA